MKEAKKDIVKAYAHVGGPEKAWEFFQRTGGDYAPKMMEALAELYWEQGQFQDSSRVYKKVIAQNMDSPRICEWQNKIVRNTLSAGNKKDQVQEIERLGAVFDKVGDMKGVKKDQLEECRNTFHDTTKELALIWHKEAQKTKNPDTYALDKFVYKVFLDHFPKDKDAYEMAYYYGELLWTLENWKDAAEQYTKVVEMNPDGKYVKDAAYAAVLAWKNALNVDDHEHADAGRERPRDREEPGGQGEDRGDGDPRVPEEDDRGLRHLHQVRPRRAGAGDDQVPQGAHLLRVQPLRRGREAVRGHRAEVPEARAVDLLGEPAARLFERAGEDQGGRRPGSTSSSRCPSS